MLRSDFIIMDIHSEVSTHCWEGIHTIFQGFIFKTSMKNKDISLKNLYWYLSLYILNV